MTEETQRPRPKSWEKRLFVLTLIVYAILLVAIFSPFGLILVIAFFCIELLWIYTGVLLTCLTFPIWFLLAKRRGATAASSLASAARRSVVVFGALGLMLCPASLFVPGYEPFTLGYWMHAKVWLNVSQVRQWAAQQEAPTNTLHSVPYRQWPPTLRSPAFGSGRLHLDPETKAVTLIDGGGFGHWGIRVADTNETENPLKAYSIPLESGAWAWHEIQ